MTDTALDLFKTLLVPAVVSLFIYLSIAYVLVPLWRRHRTHYSRYLPRNAWAQQTSTWRNHLTDRFAAPSAFLSARHVVFTPGAVPFDNEEGEELGDMDEETWRSIGRHVPSVASDNMRRLSRDLEEGFMDDSDDEPDPRLAT